jgi:hypothetical protein
VIGLYGRAFAWRTAREKAEAWLDGRACCIEAGKPQCVCEQLAEREFPDRYAAAATAVARQGVFDPHSGVVVSVDLGYVNDPSTVVTIVPDRGGVVVTTAVRLKLRDATDPGMSYFRVQFRQLADVVARAATQTKGPIRVVVDVTGNTGAIGTLREELAEHMGRIELWPIWISPGDKVNIDPVDGRYKVGKQLLVETSRADFLRLREDGTPWIAINPRMRDLEEFTRQLRTFGAKVTASGNVTFEGRQGHDDLALAAFQGLWALGRETSARVVGNPINYDSGGVLRNLLTKGQRVTGEPIDLSDLPQLTDAAMRTDWWGNRTAFRVQQYRTSFSSSYGKRFGGTV